MSGYYRGVLSLVFVMMVWGSSFTVTKVVVSSLPPVYFAFLRFGVASIVMLGILLWKRRPGLVWKSLPHVHLIAMALSGVSLFYIFFNYSLKYTAASTGALLEGFIPVLIAILASIFLREKLSRWQIFGIGVSFTGILLLSSGKMAVSHASNPLLGNLLMLVAILCWAVYTILSKKVAHLDPVVVTFYVTIAGTLFFLPSLFFEMRGRPWPMPSPSAWLAIIYLGAIGSAVCYLLYNKALETLNASQVGNFLNLDPVTGAIIAIVFLDESIGLFQLAGCALVFTGVWLSTKSGSKPA